MNGFDQKFLENLNYAQKKAVDAPRGQVLIVAGAGTGKTKTLISRIAKKILEGVSPVNILAITFTNKAAREMRDRLESYGLENPQWPGFIGTFHSFGARFLRSRAGLVGRKNNFVIYDSGDSFSVIKKIARLKNIKSPSALRSYIDGRKNCALEEGMEEKLEDAFLIYEQVLTKSNAFDFNDLISKPLEILRNNPQERERAQRTWRHIFLDEYQDINNSQYFLVKEICGDNPDITAVGDDQQTIYSWRGSNFRFFLDFEKDWPRAQVINLTENYRSTPQIISASQDVSAKNKFRRENTLSATRPNGEAVRIIETTGEEEEACWIASDLGESLGKYTNAAILYRTNAQSRALEQSLVYADIPYVVWGGLAFYERKEIRDILAGVRVCNNPQDEQAVDRLRKNLRKKERDSFKSAIEDKLPEGPAQAIDLFLTKTNYMDMVRNEMTSPEERMENIMELKNYALGFSSTEEFLEKISLLQSTDKDHKKAKVQLSTIHMAKGLEFPIVYVAGCTEGLLPHSMSFREEGALEEERRLMYVAMTRAKDKLTATFYGPPSRFLMEIDPSKYQFTTSHGDSGMLEENEEDYISLD